MDFPLLDGQALRGSGGNVTVADGAANAEGSWVELVAATEFAASWLLVNLSTFATGAVDFLVDIGVGTAGNEASIVDDLPYAPGAAGSLTVPYLLRLSVPAGSRLAARCRSSSGAASASVRVMYGGGGFAHPAAFQKADTYGANLADSGGVQLDPGGTINTKGAYSEITAATLRPIRELILSFPNGQNGTRTTAFTRVDVAIGAAASEQIIIPDFLIVLDAALDVPIPQASPPLPVSIPAGTRIAARCQCNINDATDRLVDIVLVGLG